MAIKLALCWFGRQQSLDNVGGQGETLGDHRQGAHSIGDPADGAPAQPSARDPPAVSLHPHMPCLLH